MSQWLDVKAGEVSVTWVVPAGENRSYMTDQKVYPTGATDNPASKAWYGWAMLGLAAIAALAVLKGRK